VKCFNGNGWDEFERRRNGIQFRLVESPTGQTAFVKPADLSMVKYQIWAPRCLGQNGAAIRRVDLSGPYAGASFSVLGTSLRDDVKLNFGMSDAPRPFGLCIENTYSQGPVDVAIQLFVPKTECVAKGPTIVPWTGGAELAACGGAPPPAPPPPPPPDPTPVQVLTCSGAEATPTATDWVLTLKEASGCASVVTIFANSRAEAEGCAASAQLTPVPQVCEFDVQLESGPAYHTFPIAADEADAISCAKAYRCGNCDAVVVAKGQCFP
jgi:hypothetical protein